MTPLIHVENLRIHRGDFVLRIDDWQVRPGEIVGLVGPNGAGKTTLLEMLHGVYPPDSGSVKTLGMDPWRRPVEVRSQVGYGSEAVEMFPMKVGKLFQFLGAYYPGSWDPKLADDLLDRFSIDRGKKVGSLSKGQEIAVRLVAAIAFRPKLLLLDEPTSGLDLGHRQRLTEILLELVKEGDRSVVLSSHNLNDVERISDRLLVLGDGTVRGHGSTDELVGDDRTLEEVRGKVGELGWSVMWTGG